jgi:hypothetical protein
VGTPPELIYSDLAKTFDEATELYEQRLLPAIENVFERCSATTMPDPKKWRTFKSDSLQAKKEYKSLVSAQAKYKALYFCEGE